MKTRIQTLLLALLFAATGFAQQVTAPPPLMPVGSLTRKTTALSRATAMLADPAPIGLKAKVGRPEHRASLSQGDKGACVGFSYANWLNMSNPKPWYNVKYDFALDLYRWARDHDMWPDNDGDDAQGTNPYDAERRLHQLKYTEPATRSAYLPYEKDLRKQILTVGPAVLALDWYSGFDVPDANGGIHLNGYVRGGHAIPVFWFEPKGKVKINGKTVTLPARYYLLQSWSGYGPYDKWGQVVWMPAADMRRVLNRGGTASAPIKNKTRVK